MASETEKLADELFKLVEYDQGYSYISDGMGQETRESIIEVARVELTEVDPRNHGVVNEEAVATCRMMVNRAKGGAS